MITSIITINGNGATIERDTGIGPRFRILEVAAVTGDLTLNNVTIQGGHTGDSGGGDATSGGGLYNNGQLTINDSIIQNNRTGDALAGAGKGGFGGGLYNSTSGSVALDNVTFTGNTTGLGGGLGGGHGGPGGAIANDGVTMVTTFSISNSLIEQNTTGGSSTDGGQGGGIFNNGPMSIFQTTIRNNTTGEGFGGSAAGAGDNGGNGGFGGGVHNQGTHEHH